MSRKDYEAIAQIMTDHRGICDEATLDLVSHALAAHFAKDNARFDTERFLAAAGVA
jgi:hypothetical protein